MPRSEARTLLLAAVIIAALAFVWTVVVGRRGFFPLDESVALDGAYRVASGQVPFRDFRTPYGLTTFALAGGWLALFGVSFASFLTCAAALNALASLLAIGGVWLLVGSGRLGLLAGALTAIWFQPPFGLPYPEQTAFFFAALGLTAAVLAVERQRPWGWLVAGLCSVAALLAKQNAGALLLPLLGTWLWLGRRRSSWPSGLLWLALGFLAGSLAFLLWLACFAQPAQFVEAWWRVPSGLLGERLRQYFPYNLGWIFFGKGNAVARFIFVATAAAVIVALVRSRRTERRASPRAALLCLTLVLYQHLFNVLSNSRPENGYAFAGWIVALALASTRPWIAATPWRRIVAASLVALLAAWGLWTGWARRVHAPLRDAAFTGTIDRDGWRSLRWGEPTRIHGAEVRAADVNAVLRHLERRGGSFFVFPEFTALYAMLDRPAPQPLLWFHWDLTYPGRYDASLDAAIVDGLRAHDVRTIVYETTAWMDPDRTLGCFPQLAAFVGRFRETARYGIFRMLER